MRAEIKMLAPLMLCAALCWAVPANADTASNLKEVKELIHKKGIDTGDMRILPYQSYTDDMIFSIGVNSDDELVLAGINLETEETSYVLYKNDTTGYLVTKEAVGGKVIQGNGTFNPSGYELGDLVKAYSFENGVNPSNKAKTRFEIRSGAMLEELMRYADFILFMNDSDYAMKDIGFPGVGDTLDGEGVYALQPDEFMGVWEYDPENDPYAPAGALKNRILISGQNVYWRSFDPAKEEEPSEIEDFEGYQIGSDFRYCLDACTLEVIAKDTHEGGSYKDHYKRYIHRGDEGQILMRVESEDQGLESIEDGKTYVLVQAIDEAAEGTVRVNHFKVDDGDVEEGVFLNGGWDNEDAEEAESQGAPVFGSFSDSAGLGSGDTTDSTSSEGADLTGIADGSTSSGTDMLSIPDSRSDNTSSSVTMGERNALQSAKDYLDVLAFSYDGLIDQLEYEGYSYSEAKYAADHCGADWKEQAAKSAKNYLDVMSFSRDELISQLEYEGYTHEQAVYGASRNGY
ncbi:MAG: Ltp family lipoprotein [Lachnospiraceae bacterium]|nr:Ltp family lipoprotein [Lachnospiraceae bacterium]